jgi:hypothetical protein
MKHPSDLDPGQIKFHQSCRPPITPGMYTVKVNQNVTQLGNFDSEPFTFSVAGPRFSLSPSDVYSVYPPNEKAGDFASTLPHVVFSRRTLPWERSVTGEKDDTSPWMALLVFSAADFPTGSTFPDIVTRPVGELVNPDNGESFVGPKLNLQDDESPKDLCTTVDIPWDVFQANAPRYTDLEFLAHVREVNTGAKETSSFLADGWFSVVLANRFPQPQEGEEPRENRAYLVSLEGLKDYLPDSTDNPAKKPVRLAVLSSWSFRCSKAFTFISSMRDLNVARIEVPWKGGPPKGSQDAKESVRAAYQRGYTALNHSTRLGEKAVSWYRGPLVPLYLARLTSYTFRPVADAAVRYDPLQGMMDVTYAGAFQLGRLLALQDRQFAVSLYAYRTRVRRHVNGLLSKNRLGKVLGVAGGLEPERNMMRAYLSKPPGTSPRRWSEATEDGFEPAQIKSDTEPKQGKEDTDLTVPENVRQWLGRLMLLYRVPFNYLVPDERMLPKDSIRFFYLDPGWLKCLLEGACSVGRASSRDELVDMELRDNFLKYAIEESRMVRTQESLAAGSRQKPLDAGSWTQLTGFLLRSPVVEGWQGLEMRAWETWKKEWDADEADEATKEKNEVAKKENELKPLRIDRLAPDMMLCIFDGKLNYIEIKQPPEGMHFGAAIDQGGTGYKSSLRSLVKSPGEQVSPAVWITVNLRGVLANRVVDVATFAGELQKKLQDDTGGKPFTSAGLGVEMVLSPGRVVFDVNCKEPPKADPNE